MRHLFATLLVLPLTVPCRAEEAKPNTLTAKEIADGWILLFDGETTFGWKATNDSRWTITEGMLTPQAKTTGALVTTTAFNDYELSMEFQAKEGGYPQVIVSRRMDVQPKKVTTVGRVPPGASADPTTEYIIPLQEMGKGWNRLRITVKGARVVSSSFEGPDAAVKLKVEPIIPSLGPSHFALAGNGFLVRNIKLKPLDTKPLFNGKDLTGWKKFEADLKRAKSQYTVTKEGWLSIKNGPGDLQTTGEWADFVLQLDCRTNGDNLNSGVFFRCIPDQYQNGYEAQIQNQRAKTLKTYTVEEYDPKTHKVADKKKVENWSQDYGTGAIYRRVPARRAAAKDREWFTMTVVARGRHLATWVNGIQTVDWNDNRPEKDNARNGCRLKKGPISLQGHDPTTDLSFRNLRIADLAGKN
ncbi:MAG TPA: DUF1080 domain-containing protein [Gemmataceae bacterium]|jgi:hypothetical protein